MTNQDVRMYPTTKVPSSKERKTSSQLYLSKPSVEKILLKLLLKLMRLQLRSLVLCISGLALNTSLSLLVMSKAQNRTTLVNTQTSVLTLTNWAQI